MNDFFRTQMSDLTLAHLLRIIREVALLVLGSILLYHLVMGNIEINLPDLSASELVSILLAFFAIALAVSFYFAATRQSNDFYLNVNRFTKETSTILGRLDEQVKNLGGRQSELKDSLDKYYFGGGNEKLGEAQENTEKQVEEVNQNISQIIGELFDKAQLEPQERQEFEGRIRQKDTELSKLRERLGRLAMRAERPVRFYTRKMLKSIGLETAIEMPGKQLLLKVAQNGPSSYRRDLHALGYLVNESPNDPNEVTDEGEQMVMSELTILIERTEDS